MKLTKHCLFGGLALASIISIILAIVAVFIIATVRSTAWLVVILTVIAWVIFAFFVNAEDEDATPEENDSAKRFEKIYMIGSAVATVIAIIILLLSFFGIGASKKSESVPVPAPTTTSVSEKTTEPTTVGNEDRPIDDVEGDDEEITTKPSQSNSTGNTTRPSQNNSTGNTTRPSQNNSTGNTTRPSQNNSTGNTTRPSQSNSTGNTTRPSQNNSTGNTQTHTHEVERYANSSTTYEQNGSKHIVVVYQGDKICGCNYNMGKGTTTRTEEAHSYGSDGKCICGAVKPVEDTTTTTQPSTTTHTHEVERYANSSTTYEQNGSKHIVVVYQGDKICGCNHNMGKGTTTRTEEAHSYGSDGKCICGAVKPVEKSIILSCSRQDEYGDPAMGPNDTVTLTLKNMTVDEVECRWVNSNTSEYQTNGVYLKHLYGDVYEIILSDEIWKCAADIQIRRPGTSNWYTVTLEPQY